MDATANSTANDTDTGNSTDTGNHAGPCRPHELILLATPGGTYVISRQERMRLALLHGYTPASARRLAETAPTLMRDPPEIVLRQAFTARDLIRRLNRDLSSRTRLAGGRPIVATAVG